MPRRQSGGESKWLNRLESLVAFLSRAHMAVFYFTGRFYAPSYRLVGLEFGHTREVRDARQRRP